MEGSLEWTYTKLCCEQWEPLSKNNSMDIYRQFSSFVYNASKMVSKCQTVNLL